VKNPATRYGILCALTLTLAAPVIGFAESDTLPVTAARVSELLDRSPQRGVHPRVFFSTADVQRMRRELSEADPIMTLGRRRMLESARETVSQPLLAYHLDDAQLRVPSVHRFAVQLPPLVLSDLLSSDTALTGRAVRQMLSMSAYPDWGAERHFLDAGIAAFDFAMVYDALYERLTSEQRSAMRSAVLKYVLLPGRDQMRGRKWWSTANHNWNGICHGGIIMAALACYEDMPEDMAEVVSLAVNNLPRYIKSFEPDGQSEEGVMYWGYGLTYTTLAIEAMKRVLGTDFGLDRNPGFRKTGWFPALMSGPVTGLSIGDDPVKENRSRSFFWFAKNFRDTALAQLQYDLCLETKDMAWADLIHYDRGMALASAPVKVMPKMNHTRGIEVMSLRTGWDRNATFVSLHGGHNNANHGHLDAGSFDIQSDGVVWAYGNLGRDDYTYPGYFTKQTTPDYNDRDTAQTVAGRWHFYRLRAEGKNCLVIDPGIRFDQNEKGEAPMVREGARGDKTFYQVDLSDCYARDVTAYSRGIRLDSKNRRITVQDELNLRNPSELWWQMHTQAAMDISKDGRTATLRMKGKSMTVRIVKPSSGVRFTELPATYIPGRSFPLTKNSENTGFRKLAIRHNSAGDAVVSVDFIPMESGTSKSKNDYESMSTW
jgi:hypothetical protein